MLQEPYKNAKVLPVYKPKRFSWSVEDLAQATRKRLVPPGSGRQDSSSTLNTRVQEEFRGLGLYFRI